jgi:uncharacterized protein
MAKRAFQLGKYDEATRSITVVASTRNPVKGIEVKPDGTQVPRLEALESWDLTRFEKNPVILWQHEAGCSAIGLASDVAQTDAGLVMRINFAAASDEPRADEAIKRIKAGLVRGVSVGFDFGDRTDEERDGVPVAVFRGNVLSEVSLVTIPADEDALAGPPPGPVLSLEEQRRQRVSSAARDLALSRHKRSDADDVIRFDTTNRLGKVQRTQLGGIRVPARLARIGVLEYRRKDGTIRRELRLPEEVFHPDSLDTLRSATVTDLEHHRDFIDTESWKEAALGHVEQVRVDQNQYVLGELVINDKETIARIDAGELADISCGYACKLEAKPGVWNGKPYDVIQRNIRHNHVAVLPPGRGRSGTEVGIRLDADDAESVEEPPTETPKENVMKMIHFDGKDYEYGSEQHVAAITAQCAKQVEAAKAETAALQKRADESDARFDAAEKAAKKSAAEKAADDAKADAARAAGFKRRLRLMRAAFRAFGEEEDDETSGTTKMDALDDLSERDLMVKVIKHLDSDFDDEGKSDAYVEATFDITMRSAKRADGVDNVVKVAETIKRADAKDKDAPDPERAAREAMQKRNREAASKPLGPQV